MANQAIIMLSSLQNLKWYLYHLWLEGKMIRVRKQKRIRFLFILQELSQWKTEMLYKAMLNHPRFDPILGITPCKENLGAEQKVVEYCREHNYRYVLLSPEKTIVQQLDVDLIAHQKPYSDSIHPLHQINPNKRIPTVYIPYYLSTITEGWLVNPRNCLLAWRQFVDNESCRKEWAKVNRLHGINYSVTGLPFMDELMIPKTEWQDVWPNHDHRKRVVYAPHHTIGDIHMEGIGYSTFLEYYDFMLKMRDKYKDQVYFVFKPHPRLYRNLLSLWGRTNTEEYYKSWNLPGYSHVETNSEYIALLKHSDAMIHDCGSFTIEYLYMDNPVMYLTRDNQHSENLNAIAKRAFDLHYKGYSKADIEDFIVNTIKGEDPLKRDRESFKTEYLISPNGKSACESIMNVILGKPF